MKSQIDCSSVTALCPTFGRFERLRDAIACFLLQEYSGYKHLIILNDAPIPLRLTSEGNELIVGDTLRVTLENRVGRFPNLGQKRQALLELASSDIVAHWEDDDLYLPWHLSSRVATLLARPEIECVKPVMAWWVEGPPNKLKVVRWQRKAYDGQMVFKRGTAVDYIDGTRSIPKSLIRDYYDRRVLDRSVPSVQDTTYIYRINDGIKHLCRMSSNHGRAHRKFARANKDFGQRKPLLPASYPLEWARDRMYCQFRQILRQIKPLVEAKDFDAISKRLVKALVGVATEEDYLEFWEDKGSSFYSRMYKRHRVLWKWVAQYVTANNVKSVIEIGGGQGAVCKLLPPRTSYTNIEMNGRAVNVGRRLYPNASFIHADFGSVNPADLPQCDLLLATAVIEHCPHYDMFLERALATGARRILVTFFRKLSGGSDDSFCTKKTTGGLKIHYNRYSEHQLRAWLDSKGLNYSIIDIGTDHILEITQLAEQPPVQARLELAKLLGSECRHDPEQIAQMFNLIRERKFGRMIEVGSYQGGSALVYAGALKPGGDILLIDLCRRRGALPKLHRAVSFLQAEGLNVELFAGDSASTNAESAAADMGQVDFLYIDGCHDTKMVVRDYMTYRRYVRDGGLIGFHDVCRPRLVKRAWAYLTAVWSQQGLRHWIIGRDDWDRRRRPWATGMGVVEWQRSAMDKVEEEAKLIEIVAMVQPVESN